MKLQEFKEWIESINITMFNRANLINCLIPIKTEWSYILRTLLFCSNTRIISKQYLLEKIKFMLKYPNIKHEFLDKDRRIIFYQLRYYLQKPRH